MTVRKRTSALRMILFLLIFKVPPPPKRVQRSSDDLFLNVFLGPLPAGRQAG
jgi:hypothetical protein